MSDFIFLRPAWLGLLPVLALAVWWVRRRQRRQRNDWSKVVDADLLAAQTEAATGWTQLLGWLVTALLTLCIFAMAGPSFRMENKPLASTADTRLFLMDISLSMNAHDISPSRMIRTQQVAAELIKASGAYRVGLIAYAGDAWLVSPVTRDSKTVTSFLDIVDTSLAPVQGSRPDRALQFAHRLIGQANVQRAEIILFNDGFNGSKVYETAERLHDEGHKIIVIAAGTTTGARIPLKDGGYMRSVAGPPVVTQVNGEELGRLADAGGGELHWIADDPINLTDTADTRRTTDPDNPSELSTENESAQTLSVRLDDGPWLLLPALLLAALVFRRGALFCLPLLLMTQPIPTVAAEPFSWWWRPDQQVVRAIKRGDLDRAAAVAPNDQWLGVISYRRGDYAGAAIFFGAQSSATAYYNRANALVKQERYAQAIEAYNNALRQNPSHVDALYNRDLVLAYVDKQNQLKEKQKRFQFDDDQQATEQSEDASNDTSTDSRQAREDRPEESAEQTEDAEPSQDTVASSDAETQVSPEYTEDRNQLQVDLDQWLKKVPDDPAAWLRRRFSQMQQTRERNVSTQVGDAW